MSNVAEQCKGLQKSQIADVSLRSASGITPGKSGYLPVKLVAEWATALALLILAAPLALVVAILVKIGSPGPVFYAQTRLGLDSKVFRMFKFRTMVHNAEGRSGPVWAMKNDSRITPIGQFLRATHLDELPQLWNVLRGEMSLIGPRPERPEIADRIARQIPDFYRRLAVRPGITGLAQLLLPADDPNDAAMSCVQRKLAHDVLYITKLGFMLDLRIAMSTPCYFLAAAVHAVQRKLVQRYEVPEETDLFPADSVDRNCPASPTALASPTVQECEGNLVG